MWISSQGKCILYIYIYIYVCGWAGVDYSLWDTCAEICCMPQGVKKRVKDTHLVKRILREVKTTRLVKALADWIKKHPYARAGKRQHIGFSRKQKHAIFIFMHTYIIFNPSPLIYIYIYIKGKKTFES